MNYLYIKPNHKLYDGMWGVNGYFSFEYGNILPNGKLQPVGKNADALAFTIPIRCDFIGKDTMRIWSDTKEIKWKYPDISDAVIVEVGAANSY